MTTVVVPDRVTSCMGLIAHNAARPGVDQAVDRCLDDVEALRRDRRITDAQREALRLILLGIGLHAA